MEQVSVELKIAELEDGADRRARGLCRDVSAVLKEESLKGYRNTLLLLEFFALI